MDTTGSVRRPRSPRRLALVLGGLLIGCTPPGGEPSGTQALPVAVSVPPLADVVEAIGGDGVGVVIALPPGRDPHSFEVSPRRAAALETARLVVTVGSAALPWEELLTGSKAPVRLVLGTSNTRATGTGSPGTSSSGSGPPETGAADLHRWLDLTEVEETIDPLVLALAELDPGNRDRYRSRAERFRNRVTKLRAEVDGLLRPWRGAVYFVDHGAWSPLTRPRGLVERALAEGHREATPATLARRIEEARRIGTTTLFVRPGRLSGAAESFLEATGARPVVLDPLARPWEETIRTAAGSIAEALRGR
ncbi:MAG: zinc ABC transporter substrate-binding protein [Thermoanaerobaculia bacterium]|nr:zinc ABC transporter substrate-binding protein [Thermoanaerobaculia bacterium]